MMYYNGGGNHEKKEKGWQTKSKEEKEKIRGNPYFKKKMGLFEAIKECFEPFTNEVKKIPKDFNNLFKK